MDRHSLAYLLIAVSVLFVGAVATFKLYHSRERASKRQRAGEKAARKRRAAERETGAG